MYATQMDRPYQFTDLCMGFYDLWRVSERNKYRHGAEPWGRNENVSDPACEHVMVICCHPSGINGLIVVRCVVFRDEKEGNIIINIQLHTSLEGPHEIKDVSTLRCKFHDALSDTKKTQDPYHIRQEFIDLGK